MVLTAVSSEADARNHLMGLAAQLCQHTLGIGFVGWFAQHLAVYHYHGISRYDEFVAAYDGFVSLGFLHRNILRRVVGRQVSRIALVDTINYLYSELYVEATEKFLPPWRIAC